MTYIKPKQFEIFNRFTGGHIIVNIDGLSLYIDSKYTIDLIKILHVGEKWDGQIIQVTREV